MKKPAEKPTLDSLRKSLRVFIVPGIPRHRFQYRVQVSPPAVRLCMEIDGRWSFVEEANWKHLVESAVRHGFARYPRHKPSKR